MAAVLLVSIGPVQDFIASARRCGDLRYGSRLLSELAKAAAAGIVDALNGQLDVLIFPSVTDRASLAPGSGVAVANKLLARVPDDAARRVAEAGRAAMASRRDQMARDAFAELGEGDAKRAHHFLEARAWAQVADLVEYTWIAVREPARADGYAHARREAERMLDARKGIKLWGQPSWSDAVPKSSLDGVRESVLHEDLFSTVRRDPGQAEWLRREYGVRASERLCGVGLLKRAGVQEDGSGRRTRARFFSTPHVAAGPLMARCKDQRAAFESYAAVLRKAFGAAAATVLHGAPDPFHAFGRADGQIFFSGQLAELAEESSDPDARGTGVETARRALLQFFRATGTSEPAPYYAVLLADGDRMGRAIDAASTFEQHRALSRCLAGFAGSAANVVKAHAGSLLYAGGDDVLALLPLHTVLACASALRRDFADRLRSFVLSEGGTPTLSVGIGISHYVEPMDAALELARRSERLAKESHDAPRNALAVILEKRGGSPIEVRGRWEQSDGMAPLDARLAAMIDMHRRDAVPDKAAFDLAALGAQLRGGDPRLIAAEARRILLRKQPRHGIADRLATADREDLEAWGLDNPVRLANELLVARQLAEAKDLADGPLTAAEATR